MRVSIYEQDCHGKTQWRVMRDDALPIMDCHQVDFVSEEDAVDAVFDWVRRNKLGPVQIRVRYRSRADQPRVLVG
jgi:hypothetical protein